MPLYLDDFIKILAQLCDDRKLRVTLSESIKGGLATGAAAFIGGLVLGPIGFAIGGLLGGGAATVGSFNKFQPVAVVLKKLTPRQKEELYKKVQYAFRDFGPQDVLALTALISSQIGLQELAINVVKSYLINELSLKMA